MVVPGEPVLLGSILPASLMHSQLYAVLGAFVAINTVMYGALAVAKMLPKVYPSDWFSGRNRRGEVRGIHPEGTPMAPVPEPLPLSLLVSVPVPDEEELGLAG